MSVWLSVSLIFFNLDDELINTIFEACQSDIENPGLILEDVQREDCIAAVDGIVGESNGDIDYLFEAADANGDGIVMRSEVSEAFQSLALQRSQKTCEKRQPRGYNRPVYHCAYMKNDCCSCYGCTCPDKC